MIYSKKYIDIKPHWSTFSSVKNIIEMKENKKWYQHIGDFFNVIMFGLPYKIGTSLGLLKTDRQVKLESLKLKKQALKNLVFRVQNKAKKNTLFYNQSENTTHKIIDYINNGQLNNPYLDKNENFIIDYVPSDKNKDEVSSLEYPYSKLIKIDENFLSKLKDPNFQNKLLKNKIDLSNKYNQEIISQNSAPIQIEAARSGIKFIETQLQKLGQTRK